MEDGQTRRLPNVEIRVYAGSMDGKDETHDVMAMLTATGIFRYLDERSLEALKFFGIFGEYGPGEVVIHEGSDQDRLYFVVSGELEVATAGAGKEVILGTLGHGECLGEISIFEPGLASATVRVISKSVLWSLDVESLQQYFEQAPTAGGQLLLGIAQQLSRRLRHANQIILENRILPQHLGVRSGAIKEPIKADTVPKDHKAGMLGGLFGRKEGPKISTDVKR